MLKRVLIIIGLLGLGAGLINGFNDEFDNQQNVHIILHKASDVEWADLTIDGKSYGVVRKGRPLVVELEVGKSYLFRVSRTWGDKFYSRERLQRIKHGKAWVVLLPELESREESESRGQVDIVLPSDSPLAWANLSINGMAYGMIKRSETRRFWLRADMTHTIVVERVWEGKRWLAKYEANVRDGQLIQAKMVLKAR